MVKAVFFSRDQHLAKQSEMELTRWKRCLGGRNASRVLGVIRFWCSPWRISSAVSANMPHNSVIVEHGVVKRCLRYCMLIWLNTSAVGCHEYGTACIWRGNPVCVGGGLKDVYLTLRAVCMFSLSCCCYDGPVSWCCSLKFHLKQLL